MAHLRILISGAGVAGIALAFWLSKLGHSVTVVERFPSLRVTGLQLDLRGQGIVVMKRMGIEAAFRANASPEQGLQVVDTHNRRWAYFGANKSGKGSQSFTSEYEIMRSDLCRIMYDAAKHRVRYIFGTSISSYDDDGDGNGKAVTVRFANGTAEEFDLVVGADGLHSRTRRILFGDTTTNTGLVPLKDHVAYLRIPRPMKPGEEYLATGFMAPGGRFVLTRRSNPRELQVYLSSQSMGKRLASVTRGDVDAEKRAFEEEFRGAGWQTDELLGAMLASDDFYCESQALVKLPSWSRGRVTLLGDAAYSSAASGLGTSAALIGAYVLAGEIGRHVGRGDDGARKTSSVHVDDGLRIALEAYERVLRPHADGIQKEGGESMFGNIRWTAWQVWMVYWLFWMASVVRADKLLGLVMGDGGKWKVPDYEELR